MTPFIFEVYSNGQGSFDRRQNRPEILFILCFVVKYYMMDSEFLQDSGCGNMKINLITKPKGEIRECDVRQGISIENLCYEIKGLPYRILAAKVNNRIVDLNYTLDEPCTVELLDMRTEAATILYQASLSLIYVKSGQRCAWRGSKC